MADNTHLLLRSNLKQLRLPTIGAEFEKLAREAASANENYEQYLLRLTELEVTARWGVAGIFYAEILVFGVSALLFTVTTLRGVTVPRALR